MNTLNNFVNSATKMLGISAVLLLTMLDSNKAQAADKVILATGNNLETAFGERTSNSDGRVKLRLQKEILLKLKRK